jgi:carboxyl-terminal processing protease
VGYVRISQFQEATPERFAKELGALRQENRGPLKGLVLDLRNNPGGLLYGAIALASVFLPDDVTVLQLEGRAEDSNKRFSTNPKDFRASTDFRARLPEEMRRVPLVVLVNGGSAAASEIVAGAMQDYKRATVVGSKTFGRGSIQTIIPMEGSTALKVTTAYWKLPGGRAIHGQGIVPDVVLEGDAGKLAPGVEFGAADDPGLQRALLALRK